MQQLSTRVQNNLYTVYTFLCCFYAGGIALFIIAKDSWNRTEIRSSLRRATPSWRGSVTPAPIFLRVIQPYASWRRHHHAHSPLKVTSCGFDGEEIELILFHKIHEVQSKSGGL